MLPAAGAAYAAADVGYDVAQPIREKYGAQAVRAAWWAPRELTRQEGRLRDWAAEKIGQENIPVLKQALWADRKADEHFDQFLDQMSGWVGADPENRIYQAENTVVNAIGVAEQTIEEAKAAKKQLSQEYAGLKKTLGEARQAGDAFRAMDVTQKLNQIEKKLEAEGQKQEGWERRKQKAEGLRRR